MVEHLRIFHHENNPPIFELEGYLTKKTIMTLIVNIDHKKPFILQMDKIEGIDKFASRLLIDLSKICKFEIWDANKYVAGFLKGIKASIRP